MLKFISGTLLVLVLTRTVAAQHPVCTDEVSAQAYLDRFATDMTAASEAGKIDAEATKDIQSTLNDLTAALSTADYGAFCNGLDELRADYAF